MKNCGNRFHIIAANKDILGDLTKILSTKVSMQFLHTCSCYLVCYCKVAWLLQALSSA